MASRRLILAAATGFMAPLPRRVFATRAQIGEVTALTGTAVAVFTGESPRPLAVAAAVLVEDILATRAGTRLACRLEGGTTLSLGENASIRLDAAMLQRPRPGYAIRSFGGPMLLDLPPAAPRDAAPPTGVTLPWAHIGVRGTRFFAGEVDGARAVFVERGQVEVTANDRRAVLSAGEGVDVMAGGGPGPVTRWGAARIARSLALVT